MISLLDEISKTQATKAKIDEWNHIKLRSFWIAKKTIGRVKGQCGMGEITCQPSNQQGIDIQNIIQTQKTQQL
jgi:hypothetical protein